MKRLGVIINEKLFIEVKIKSIRLGCSMSEYITKLIEQDLSKEKDTPHRDK